MGRLAVAEDKLLTSLKKLSSSSGFCFGLILGQRATQKDNVLYFAPTSRPLEEGGDAVTDGYTCSVKDLNGFEDCWIGNQTRYVMKMIPGGLSILGVFVTCPDSSNDSAVFNKLRTLAIFSYNSTRSNQFLHNIDNSNRLLLQYCVKSKTFVCKSVDAGSLNASLQSVDFKFANELFKWYSVESRVSLDNFPSYFINESESKSTLKKVLMDSLEGIKSKINSCDCSVDRKFVDLTDDVKSFKDKEAAQMKELEKTTGKKIDFDSNNVKIQFYDKRAPDEYSFKVEHVENLLEISFKGDICSRVVVLGSTSLEDAIMAVKEDLIRCCSTKFQMHWESNDDFPISALSNELKSEETHILPRRILFKLPESEIKFSEYLFLDETTEDVIESIQETLGFQPELSSVLDVLEAKCESSICEGSPKKSASTTSSASLTKKSNNFIVVSIIVFSLIVLLIAILIQFFK